MPNTAITTEYIQDVYERNAVQRRFGNISFRVGDVYTVSRAEHREIVEEASRERDAVQARLAEVSANIMHNQAYLQQQAAQNAEAAANQGALGQTANLRAFHVAQQNLEAQEVSTSNPTPMSDNWGEELSTLVRMHSPRIRMHSPRINNPRRPVRYEALRIDTGTGPRPRLTEKDKWWKVDPLPLP